MTSGDGLAPGGEQAAAHGVEGCVDESVDVSDDGENTTVDRDPPTTATPPQERRRKAGVRYRPI
jgi:hypothetical protein